MIKATIDYKRKARQICPWLPVILWMALIFYLSHQPASQSSELSSGVTELIMTMIDKIIPSSMIDIEFFHHFVRKNAHFFAYLVLGVLVANGLRGLDRPWGRGYRAVVLAVLICILYAISDEFHQLFIPGRAGQVMDVVIDSCGAVVGVLGYRGLGVFSKALKKRSCS